jgi:tocopherol O-methyltransferase
MTLGRLRQQNPVVVPAFASPIFHLMPRLPRASQPSPPTNAAVAEHYDSLDQFYRDIWGQHVHHGLWTTGRETAAEATEKMSHRVLAGLALMPGARVADIGCGYGGTARIAADTYGAHVLGLTLSAAQKRFADQQTVAQGSVKILVRDWRDAAFAAGGFDAMFALESLEHFADKAGFARMARAAVRPGGRLAVTTWLAADRVSSWSRRHLLDALCLEGSAAPLVTAREVRDVFSAAGFSEVLVEDLSPQVSRTWSVILRRLALRLLTRRDYWAFLLKSRAQDRVFALTALRIRLAYGTGCFRYGYFVWE